MQQQACRGCGTTGGSRSSGGASSGGASSGGASSGSRSTHWQASAAEQQQDRFASMCGAGSQQMASTPNHHKARSGRHICGPKAHAFAAAPHRGPGTFLTCMAPCRRTPDPLCARGGLGGARSLWTAPAAPCRIAVVPRVGRGGGADPAPFHARCNAVWSASSASSAAVRTCGGAPWWGPQGAQAAGDSEELGAACSAARGCATGVSGGAADPSRIYTVPRSPIVPPQHSRPLITLGGRHTLPLEYQRPRSHGFRGITGYEHHIYD
jgi:hypothetical protein